MTIGNPRALTPYFRVSDGFLTFPAGTPTAFALNDPQRIAIVVTQTSATCRIGPIPENISLRGIGVSVSVAPGYHVFHFRDFGPVIGYTWFVQSAGGGQIGFWLVSYEPPTSIVLP